MKQLGILCGFFITAYIFLAPTVLAAPIVAGSFSTTWQSNNARIDLGICATSVYWEEVGNESNNGTSTSCVGGSHSTTFPGSGLYRVDYSGNFTTIDIDYELRPNFRSVEQWGDSVWTNLEQAFYAVENLSIPAADAPNLSGVTSLYEMFQGATGFNSPINHWDVSNITNFSEMFGDYGYGTNGYLFNQPLDNWDVSAATNMRGMFYGLENFNQPLSNWNVSGVTDFAFMFAHTDQFNQPLDNWDVSSALTLEAMFDFAVAFNQPLNNWNVSNVTDINAMFAGATNFNQDISSWDVSNVTNMERIFGSGATSFNQPLNSWDVSNVTSFWRFFEQASSFNQPLDSWDMSGATRLDEMFAGATNFNQDISSWDVSNVTEMSSMLDNSGFSPENYSRILNAWASLPSLQSDVIFGATGRTYLETATSARQFLIDTYNWTINDNGLFVEPSDARFITIWDTTLSAPTNEVRFYIYGTGANFYIDWGDGNINYYPSAPGTVAYTYATPGVKTITFIGEVPAFDFCQEDPLFDKIIDVVQWGTNAWQDMDNAFNGCTHLVSFSATDAPNLSQVTNMQNMFAAATNFNGDINHWDVSNVTNMGEMFFGATAFNQPLNDWDVSSVTDMTYILGQATAFNQDLSQWDISNAFFDWIGFDGTSLSTSNYTKILLAWSQLSVQNNSFGEIGPSGNLTPYCSLAQSARDILEGTYGWGDWTDGGSVPCKTATYTAGAGGTLSGDAFQYVVDGEGGSAVTAVPQSGYRFVSWSDGSTENPRTDMNLASNLSVTAMFVVDGNSSEGTRIGARAERLLDVLSGIPVVGSIATFVTSVRDFLDYLTEHEDEIDDLTQEERTTIIIALRDILAFLLRFVPGV